MIATKEKRYTKEDYERLPEGAPYQLIGGELIMSPSPTFFHQRIISRINQTLGTYVRNHGLGEIIVSPMDVHLTEDDIYQPDALFIRADQLSGIAEDDRIHFVPDLAIEVLSPSTAYYDYSHKKTVYAERGVKEYWIVDPQDRTVEIMENENGIFSTVALFKETAMLESTMFPGFTMKVEEVFAI
ncbi:MAG TPA: Uma2 family endonuclease [Candidatus Kapabacteria bacterium]|jgi:Uma2 family endonuclease